MLQDLMQVPDRAHHASDGLLASESGKKPICSLPVVARESINDAAMQLGIVFEVNVAATRRCIMNMEEVEVPRKVFPFRVADGVGPRGNLGAAFVAIAAWRVLEEIFY
ncbi:hypothetical protein AAL_05633 [Moelleriella libera RCEF 2490]|uniref:Uncharacterized protein n=1 Tax=Moelleriella libera RCEF 2490 TaxID=1081109 RepID=A0A167ZYJ1_9HYPO|nr:hypothetical protein AAL_05633 [Moelleriella libera RCEF 2490]